MELAEIRALRDSSNGRIALLKNQIGNAGVTLSASVDLATLESLNTRLFDLSLELNAALATFKTLGVVSGDLPDADLD